MTSSYRAPGKIVLTGEYALLSGAWGLALPTKWGQSLHVKEQTPVHKNDPHIFWTCYDEEGKCWLNLEYSLTDFSEEETISQCQEVKKSDKSWSFVHQILKSLLKLSKKPFHLASDMQFIWKTEFPLQWGIGSSASMMACLGQCFKLDPVELSFQVSQGSGIDVFCSYYGKSVLYKKNMDELSENKYSGKVIHWDPAFKDSLYFIYLGQKEKTEENISKFYEKVLQRDEKGQQNNEKTIQRLSDISIEMADFKVLSWEKFNNLLIEHEKLVGHLLQQKPIKEECFRDFWGEIKNLGAWGGDFILATSMKSREETVEYFLRKGYRTVIPYGQFIL